MLVRCYEVKIEESEKAGSRWESNPGHLWLEPPLNHDSRTTTNPHNPLSFIVFTLFDSMKIPLLWSIHTVANHDREHKSYYAHDNRKYVPQHTYVVQECTLDVYIVELQSLIKIAYMHLGSYNELVQSPSICSSRLNRILLMLADFTTGL